RPRERISVLVEVAEEWKGAVLQLRGAVVELSMEAGDVVVDQLGSRGVVADDDEAWRHANARLLPQLVGLGVMAVERLQRGLQAGRQGERVEIAALAAPLLWHLLADVFPEVA